MEVGVFNSSPKMTEPLFYKIAKSSDLYYYS